MVAYDRAVTTQVALRAGAWIEIKLDKRQIETVLVALRAGAWIEMMM